MRSNCLIFAIQRLCDDGYLIVRKSRYGWWPHFIYAKSIDGVEVENFVPFKHIDWKSLPWWQRVIPVHIVLFKGKVINNDRVP